MPRLQKLTLREISARFLDTDEFQFHSFEDGQFAFICEKDLTYKLTFFPSPFANLSSSPGISDLVPAIDEQRLFVLEIIF